MHKNEGNNNINIKMVILMSMIVWEIQFRVNFDHSWLVRWIAFSNILLLLLIYY